MMESLSKLLLGCLLLSPLPAFAAPRIDPLFGDHAILQRSRPIVVRGTAQPGEIVRITLAGRKAVARTDADGRFTGTLAPLEAGGPYTLEVQSPTGRASSTDVVIGDVFLCSGQSNMELPVAHAQDGWNQAQSSADPMVRLMTVEKRTSLRPQASFDSAPVWRPAEPESISSFSAACFYMVQTLRRTSTVPIGAISASWGGTQISAWMGSRALVAAGRGKDVDLLALFARDPATAARQSGQIWEDWWRRATGDRPGREPWQPDSSLSWRPVPKIDVWEHWGDPALARYDGMVWFRREVTLSPEQARSPATLDIGAVDDMDRTWVNGVAVGAGGNPGALRHYPIGPGALHPGRNVIVVNADDVYADGGMRGPAAAMKLAFADGSSIPLGDGWSFSVPPRTPDNPPRAPWDDVAGVSVIYNAMIAPLGSFGFAGIAWYQGEADTGIPGYADRLAAMTSDWRQQFGQPRLPLAIVQLSSYGARASAPTASAWADLREQQRLAAERIDRAALAITIDLGDPLDIHPGEKHEVGRRLARAMATLVYHTDQAPSGPAIAGAVIQTDGTILLKFSGVSNGLRTYSSDHVIGLELCAARGSDCRYATGTAAGDEVRIAGDGKPVAEIRYAWADAPVVNLYDAAGLPAGPFVIAPSRQ